MSPDSERFHDPPAMLVEHIVSAPLGRKLALLMLHHIQETGSGAIFHVEFMPERLEYRTPGQKDAVLHGTARLSDCQEAFRPARILFSKYHKTATLKGLALEGDVKRAA